jgi:hypothetical protein
MGDDPHGKDKNPCRSRPRSGRLVEVTVALGSSSEKEFAIADWTLRISDWGRGSAHAQFTIGHRPSAMDNTSLGPDEKGLLIADCELRISDWGEGSGGSTDLAIRHGQ